MVPKLEMEFLNPCSHVSSSRDESNSGFGQENKMQPTNTNAVMKNTFVKQVI